MRVLVVGQGARESALLWKLHGEGCDLFCAPGNAQSALWATRWPELGIRLEDGAALDLLVDRAKKERIDLVVVGPEVPLAAGLADRARAQGLAVLGPGRDAARLESSKVWAKEFMNRHGVPTPRAEVVQDKEEAVARATAWRGPLVVKAEGLRQGKGVVVTRGGKVGAEAVSAVWRDGERLLLEERLTGEELSFLVVTDGARVWLLPPARDHKRRRTGNRGPNTGGMGAVSPPPDLPDLERLIDEVMGPTLRGLREENIDFRGVLYFGLIHDPHTRRTSVLEYNVRFGDPEAEAILPRLSVPLADCLWAAATRETGPEEGWLPCCKEASAAVVLVAAGYPGNVRPVAVAGDLRARGVDGTLLFAGAVEGDVDGPWRSTGGRLAVAVSFGETAQAAALRANQRLAQLQGKGLSFRRDIGVATASSERPPG